MSSNTDDRNTADSARRPPAWPDTHAIRFDYVKGSVARRVYESVILGSVQALGGAERYEYVMAALFDSLDERRRLEESLEALANECYDRVMAWDVGRVEKLRELFPSQFPQALSQGKLTAYIGERGHWYVESQP
jgi:hypothetical protein